MFITFEGIEGSSKTTQAGLLSEWLSKSNISHLLTKEPGSVISKECQQIRQLILSPENDIAPRAEFFLYLADRAQHVENCILPALMRDEWVISDRYSDSTLVYQGWGRELSPEETIPMINYAAQDLVPDLTFVMDLPVELGLNRARSSNTEFVGGDRMEREELSFHNRLREGFLTIAERNKNRCRVLNAEKSIEELHEEVKEVLQSFIG
jgi:dTMP kinase